MQEYYYELHVSLPKYKDIFLDFIISLTQNAVEEGDDFLIIRSEDDLSEVVFGIEEFQKQLSLALHEDVNVALTLEKKESVDWYKKYQESVKPIQVGNFYVHPSWCEEDEKAINIVIDPALAFGSGHHATTNTCLQAIENYVKEDISLLDVGCGSGILSIAAAKMGAEVDICDTDAEAISSARENFQKNNVSHTRAWTGSVTDATKKYDVVLANIIADVLIFIAKDLKHALKNNGIIILSGILNKYEDRLMKKFNDLKLLERLPQDEWVTLVLQKDTV